MPLILLERKTEILEIVRVPRTREFAYFVLKETKIEFDTDTGVKITTREYKETNEATGRQAVNNPFYINPAENFYLEFLNEEQTIYRVYTYLGNGEVSYKDLSTGVGCTIKIITPVTTTPATDGNNGTVTIEHTGATSENLSYAVVPKNTTEIPWQAEKTTTGLGFGYYTAHIKDNETLCTDSVDFYLSDLIGHGERYWLDFDQMHTGAFGQLRIYKKNYTGPTEKLDCGTGDPVIITRPEHKDKYEILKYTQADIGLYSKTRMKFLDFFSADEREHRVDFFFDGKMQFRGYILPDVYNEPFLSATYAVNITASDGLNTLKNYPYVDSNGNPFEGERSYLDIVFDCLSWLDLNLGLRSVVDVYEEKMHETTDINDTNPVLADPLFQAVVSVEGFKDAAGQPLDCETVLRRVLSSLLARIYQADGYFVVECIDAKRYPYWAVNYYSNRTLKSYEIVNPITVTALPNTGGLQWVHGQQMLELQAAWKKVVLESNLDVIENFIEGALLRDADFIPTETFGVAEIKGWTASAPYARIQEGKDKNSVTFNSPVPGPETPDDANYWKSAAYNLKKETVTRLYLKINYQVTTEEEEGIPPLFYFSLESENATLNGLATGGTAPIRWDDISRPGAANFMVNNVALDGNVQTFELITPPIPEDGNYYLKIFEAVRDTRDIHGPVNRIGIKSFRFHGASVQVLPGGFKPNEYIDVTISNPKRYTYTPDPMQVYFVDTPPSLNYKLIHYNYISVFSQQSTVWHIKGAPLPDEGEADSPLISLLAANVAYNYSRPSHVLTGTLLGKLSYQNTVREPWDEDRVFIIDGMRSNARTAQHEITLLELITPLRSQRPGILQETETEYILTEAGGVILLEY